MERFHSMTLALLGVVVLVCVAATNSLGTTSRNLSEEIAEQRQLFADDKFRVAVFGGSIAWGTGLEDRYDSYPYKLSRTVDNFAHTGVGPNYFSVCTESVVGDDAMYDVIILDYFLKYYEGLGEMARRLRARFPHAIMIFLRTWTPQHFRRKDSADVHHSISLNEWKTMNGLMDKPLEQVIAALKADTGYWYRKEHKHAEDAITEISHSVYGYEQYFGERETGKETLIAFMAYYDHHTHNHFNEIGHEAIAKESKVLIENHLFHGSELDMVNSGIHASWGRGDSCHMWYYSGGSNLVCSDNIHMVQFDERDGHFAMEVTGGPGWCEFDNHLEDDALPTRTLYVSYLTSSHDDDYPSANIEVLGQTTLLETLNNVEPKHSLKTVPVGHIPHGKTKFTITPVGTGLHPFRLAGVVLTNEIATPATWVFGPSHGKNEHA